MVVAVVLLVGVGVLRGLYQWASRDIPPPDESFFVVERPVVAQEDNAYTYFLQATNFLCSPTNGLLMSDYLAGKPGDEAEIQKLIEKNAECLALIKRGTECSICLMPPVEDYQTLFPYIHPWLEISKVIEVRTRYFKWNGDSRAAVDTAMLEMEFGHLILQDAPSLIAYLVGVAIMDKGITQALNLAADSGTPTEELGHLADVLKKRASFGSGLRKALKGDYVFSTSTIDYLQESQDDWHALSGGEESSAFSTWIERRFRGTTYFFQPNKSKMLFADLYRILIEDCPLFYSDMVFPETSEDPGGFWSLIRPNSLARMFQALLEPAVSKVMAKKCDMETQVAGTRLVVACNRFERQEGRWPERLEELVPAYLDAVPMDPFDGEPFRYFAEKGLVYSVGRNLTDEGGSSKMPDDGRTCVGKQNRYKAEDMVFGIRPAI